jgi:hypothetical protein
VRLETIVRRGLTAPVDTLVNSSPVRGRAYRSPINPAGLVSTSKFFPLTYSPHPPGVVSATQRFDLQTFPKSIWRDLKSRTPRPPCRRRRPRVGDLDPTSAPPPAAAVAAPDAIQLPRRPAPPPPPGALTVAVSPRSRRRGRQGRAGGRPSEALIRHDCRRDPRGTWWQPKGLAEGTCYGSAKAESRGLVLLERSVKAKSETGVNSNSRVEL